MTPTQILAKAAALAREYERAESGYIAELFRWLAAQIEGINVEACSHPTYLVRKAGGLYWCSVCGAIAGSTSEPRFTDVVTGSFTDGPPHPLAWVRPERAP